MPFINELMPEEAKDVLPFPVKTNNDESKPTLWKWTIDRERDAYLVLVYTGGGGYDDTPPKSFYILCWKNEQISFFAYEYMSGNKEEGQVLTWKIYDLTIPPSLEALRHEVLQLVEEALDTQGLVYDRKRVAAVHVQFNATQF